MSVSRLGDLFLLRLLGVGAWALSALLVSPALGQSQPDFAVHPSHERGLSANTAYEVGLVDDINLFNGNLVLTIPIGQRYPVGGGFNWGLTLTYNSNLWNWEERTTICDPPSGPSPEVIVAATPNRHTNAGLGWLMTPGRLESGRGLVPSSGSPSYSFIGPDGSTSSFVDPPPQSSVLYGNRGFHGRLERLGCADPQGECYRLDTPAGVIYRFNEAGQAISLADPLGNNVDITPPTGSRGSGTWEFEDPHGRIARIQLAPGSGGEARIETIELPGFGDAPSTPTTTYAFDYVTLDLPRHSRANYDCDDPQTFSVDLLARIRLNGETLYEFGYLGQTGAPPAPTDQAGLLEMAVLPSGGSYKWTYNRVGPTDGGPDFNHPGTPPPFLIPTMGVATRQMLDLPGTHGGARADLGQSTYDYNLNELDLEFGFEGPSQEKYTRVVEPDGRVRYHYFNVKQDSGLNSVGLPFSPLRPDPEDSDSGRYLSTMVMDAPRAVSGGDPEEPATNMHTPPDEPLVATYVGYYQESCPHFSGCKVYTPYRDKERTYYTEGLNGTSTGLCPAPLYQAAFHYSETTHQDYRQWGRFARTKIDGNLSKEDEVTRQVDFLHEASSSLVHPWLLGVTTWSGVEQRTWKNTTPTNAIETHHDSATGLLLRKRILKSEDDVPSSSSSSLERHVKDVIIVYSHDGAGNVVREDYYGGDVQTVGIAPLANLNLPARPVYSIRHDYEHGVRSRTVRLDPSDDDREILVLEDLTIDAATGLVAAATTATGLTTTYAYDERSRITSITPQEDAAYVFDYTEPGSDGSSARAEVRREQASATLLHSKLTFDGLGRVINEASLLPGGWAERRTYFNDNGQMQRETGLQPQGSSAKWTHYKYDAMGRLCQELRPDETHRRISHKGIQTRLEYSNVRVGSGFSPKQARTYIYDVHGRLQRVRENSGPGGTGVYTDYGYDAGGRLEAVTAKIATNALTVGDDPEPEEEPEWVDEPWQERLFHYDGRGFLTQECHPEKGHTTDSATGCVDYGGYDPLGNPASRTDGPFSLGFSYDSIGRLTQISEPGVGLLKEFSYARSNQGSDLRAGRLYQAKRHNRIAGTNYVVAETYSYGGQEGRLSSRRTTVRDLNDQSAGSQWFEQSFTYDDLGNMKTQLYPECLHASCGGTDPTRTVQYSYDQGLLTGVQDFAQLITYHRNGTLARVRHSNGLVDVTVRDPDWMPRPASMRTEIPGDPNFAWSSGNYSYDASGNIASIDSDQFYYDKVSRLVRAEVEDDGVVTTQEFSYDRFGNRTLHAPGGATVPDLPFDLLTNRFTNPTGTSSYQYDGAGNLLAWPGGTATFDATGMATATTSSEKNQLYIYTPSDERLGVLDLMQTPTAVRWTLRGLSNKVLRTFDSEHITFLAGAALVQDIQGWSWKKDYVYRSGSLLAAVVPGTSGGEETQHFHLDHLGTPRLKTDANKVVLNRHKYLPYGEELTTPSLDNEVMQFTSHERDRTPTDWDNDLDYMHARYYAPKFGRFLSLDSVLGSSERPQSWNRYGYALGNPSKFLDPDGREVVYADDKDRKFYERASRRNSRARAVLSAFAPGSGRDLLVSRKEDIGTHRNGAPLKAYTRPVAGREPAPGAMLEAWKKAGGNANPEAAEAAAEEVAEAARTDVTRAEIVLGPKADDNSRLHELGHLEQALLDWDTYRAQAEEAGAAKTQKDYLESASEQYAEDFADSARKKD